ncbi:Uncharacterised protein [uncultured archaeon]|nr:Uncharacterised protein [uncultured archaeon]
MLHLTKLNIRSYSEAETEILSLGNLLGEFERKLSNNGSLWIICENYVSPIELIPFPLMLADEIPKKTKWRLRNILTIYREGGKIKDKPLASSYCSVLFFVKNKTYHFDKDPARLPYVFKDIEWGKRKNGSSGYHGKESIRYGTKGRDPGNVVYFELRDSTARLISVSGFSDNDVFEFILKIASGPSWAVYTNSKTAQLLIEKMDRTFRFVDYHETE